MNLQLAASVFLSMQFEPFLLINSIVSCGTMMPFSPFMLKEFLMAARKFQA